MKIKLFYPILILIIFGACNSSVNTVQQIKKQKPNVIVLIGDGMGLSQISSVFYYGDKKPAMGQFKTVGLMNTSSATHKVTDSAAGGTALSCGVKTYNGAIGLNPDTVSVKNITELLSERNYKTGIIATSSITHATPASYYAHAEYRYMEEEIAQQLVESEVDFFAGGGTKYFNHRKDSVDLILKMKEKGFIINGDVNSADIKPDQKYGFLKADKFMPEMLTGRGDFLPEFTQLALDYFSKQKNNFFLMVEGSQIDWAGHANNVDYMIAEMLDFDQTVGVALDFAKNDKNTLVIVLADHETGGFALSADAKDYNTIKPSFAAHTHSTSLIPVLAFGPGAEEFSGIYQNTEIFNKISDITK